MTDPTTLAGVLEHVHQGRRLWLFLDYDGTLVPIAPTPDAARPDAPLLDLLTRLAAIPAFQPVILSGRPLATLRDFLPVAGLVLAGTYGLEVQWADGRTDHRAAGDDVRPTVENVLAAWCELTSGRAGFLLEDKGAAIALHARFAADGEAEAVLTAARQAAAGLIAAGRFRLLGGHRFLEVAPKQAHKGQSLEWLLQEAPWPEAGLIYFGDDDKDEEAFAAVVRLGGCAVQVGPARGPTVARERLASPEVVRGYLQALAAAARGR